MIAAALLLQAAVPMPPPMPPSGDWSAMPDFPLAAFGGGFDPSPFVAREVTAGRCRPPAGARRIASPIAVLIGAGGAVQRIVPAAIDCPTVEQYTVGLVSTLARRLDLATLRPGWYRYVATYRW